MTVSFMTHQGRLCLTAKISLLQVALALLAINTPKHLLERYKPNKIIIYSRDELKQYEMQQKFNAALYALFYW